ncbi:MAG: flagellin [Leptospiraceae bacterium]|nr:flagellin [Leptospiraceae bacterium]MCK6380942.1 flagellin [Leptospiraceae bacterium]NUM40002.1 flagellin [Leptospiraceae bacterium]
MIIGHNLGALKANRVLRTVSEEMDKSMEKLSTGLRINRAGDDATGFSVSEKMRTQIRGLAQAEKNAMNGISFIQVTEGSLEQVNDILQRLRELSVQSANGIYSNMDRQQVQLEVSQLIDEVERIGNTAEFNNVKTLNGQFSRASKNPLSLHVGPNQNEKLDIYVGTMNSGSLKLQSAGKRETISSPANANKMIGVVDEAIGKLSKQRADLGAYYNRIEVTAKSLDTRYMNMVAAESRIRDADMATEMVEYTKNQILSKSAMAMLVQANARPEQVVKLLTDRF